MRSCDPCLGFVKRFIGTRENGFKTAVIRPKFGAAHTDRKTQVELTRQHLASRCRCHNAFGQTQGSLGIRIGQQHAKLLAAQTAKRIHIAQTLLANPGKRLQHGVARRVTIGIVDALEKVEINFKKRQRLCITPGPDNFLGTNVEKLPTVFSPVSSSIPARRASSSWLARKAASSFRLRQLRKRVTSMINSSRLATIRIFCQVGASIASTGSPATITSG